jgi:hypothetical protein
LAPSPLSEFQRLAATPTLAEFQNRRCLTIEGSPPAAPGRAWEDWSPSNGPIDDERAKSWKRAHLATIDAAINAENASGDNRIAEKWIWFKARFERQRLISRAASGGATALRARTGNEQVFGPEHLNTAISLYSLAYLKGLF